MIKPFVDAMFLKFDKNGEQTVVFIQTFRMKRI